MSLPPEGIDLEEFEKELIRLALAKHNGNQTQAAKYLRIGRDTLRYRLKKICMDEELDDAALSEDRLEFNNEDDDSAHLDAIPCEDYATAEKLKSYFL